MNTNTKGKYLFSALVCVLFLSAFSIHGQSYRAGKPENFLLVSGSRETTDNSVSRRNTDTEVQQKKLISEKRKHPYEISTCARGFITAEPNENEEETKYPKNNRDVFFFGDTGGFISRHIVTKTSGQEKSFSLEMNDIWQISNLPVKLIAPHPDGNMIAVYESDGFSTHRISLWDWEKKTRIYAKRFHDSVNSIDWSANGTFLMVGNTSFDGITILEGTDGIQKQIFKTSPGIVSLSATGKSERSVVTYASSGKIVYTNISSGDIAGEYYTESGLQSTELCNNNRSIIGFTDNNAVAVDATTGEVLYFFDAVNPVPALYSGDTIPVWFEKNGADYPDQETWILRKGDENPEEIPVDYGTEITTASGGKDFRIFGTSKGDIFVYGDKTIIKEETNDVSPITGICGVDDGFYFISAGKLYYTEDFDEKPYIILDSAGGSFPPAIDSLTKAGNGLLLWSSSDPAPVLFWNGKDTGLKELYKSRGAISSLTATKFGVSLVEGTSRAVYIGNTGAGEKNFFQSSAGLQDAVMVSDTYMLISKSSGLSSPSPLLLVNIKTGETVPIQYSGDLCFSLTMADEQRGYLYAFSVNSESSGETKTELIFIKLNSGNFSRTQIETVAVYQDEDLTAELLPISSDRILLNLGKSSISEIKRRTGTKTNFERGYSLPLKIATANKRIATLNHDGSLSWYNITSKNIIGTTVLSDSGEWLVDE